MMKEKGRCNRIKTAVIKGKVFGQSLEEPAAFCPPFFLCDLNHGCRCIYPDGPAISVSLNQSGSHKTCSASHIQNPGTRIKVADPGKPRTGAGEPARPTEAQPAAGTPAARAAAATAASSIAAVSRPVEVFCCETW